MYKVGDRIVYIGHTLQCPDKQCVWNKDWKKKVGLLGTVTSYDGCKLISFRFCNDGDGNNTVDVEHVQLASKEERVAAVLEGTENL